MDEKITPEKVGLWVAIAEAAVKLAAKIKNIFKKRKTQTK